MKTFLLSLLAVLVVVFDSAIARADIPPVPGIESPTSLMGTILAIAAIVVLVVVFRRKRRNSANQS